MKSIMKFEVVEEKDGRRLEIVIRLPKSRNRRKAANWPRIVFILSVAVMVLAVGLVWLLWPQFGNWLLPWLAGLS